MGHPQRIILAIIFIVVISLTVIEVTPVLLKTMPSRYVARLPEPLQDLGTRGSVVPVLPTAAGSTENLTQSKDVLVSPTQRVVAEVGEPERPTPIATSIRVKPPVPLPTPSPTSTPLPRPIPPAARLNDVQHQFQTWNNCGPATTAMALSYFGLTLNQSEPAKFLKPNPEDRNVSPYEISRYVNEQTALAAVDRTNGTLSTVKRLIAAGFPVMIEVGIEPPGEYRWLGWYGHYLLVVAYDEEAEQLWVYDSWFGTSDVPMENASKEGRMLAYHEADSQWQQFNRNYIVFYNPSRSDEVASIIGEDMNDEIMWSKALDRTRADLEQSPDNQFAWFNLGTILTEFGMYEQAADAFDRAREIGLPWRMLWYQFSPYEAYYQIGRYEDVLLLANVTLEDRPYFEESFYYLGLAQEAVGEVDDARLNFQRAVDFNPHYQPAVKATISLEN